MEHSLADSILVAINPAKHKATIRHPARLVGGHPRLRLEQDNAAMVYGGPQLLVQTVEALTHIRLDYWALTTFWGFQAMVNQVGGLTVDVPFSMHDQYSGSSFDPGVRKLNGKEALAFARDRHSLPEGDFGRSEDGGRLMLASLAQFRKEFTKDPSRVFSWIAAGVKNVQTEVPLDQILALAFTATKIDPKHVENVVAPGTTGLGRHHLDREPQQPGPGRVRRPREGRDRLREEPPAQPQRQPARRRLARHDVDHVREVERSLHQQEWRREPAARPDREVQH